MLTDRYGRTAGHPLAKGIFCDCYGTLYGAGLGQNKVLIDYLNAQYAAGTPVTIISSDPDGVRHHVQGLGLHPDLCAVISTKMHYHRQLLEILIDDEPPGYLRAQTVHDPHDRAFRAKMQAFLYARSKAQAVGAAPTADMS